MQRLLTQPITHRFAHFLAVTIASYVVVLMCCYAIIVLVVLLLA